MGLYRRAEPVTEYHGDIRNINTGEVWDSYSTYYSRNVGAMFSEPHPGYRRPKWVWQDNGGPFWNINTYRTMGGSGPHVLTRGSDQYQGIVGVYSPDATDFPLLSGKEYAAEAFKRMRPAQPIFDGFQEFAELKDIPHMLQQRFNQHGLKNIGDFHLALNFGWLPLLRATQSFVKAQREFQKRAAQILRDEGKPVRRRLQIRSSTDRKVEDIIHGYGWLNPNLPIKFYKSAPSGTLTSTTSDNVWASAKFRYWLPSGPRNVQYKQRLIAELFGFLPSPSTVYNLMPWSWLIDYFTNLGDVIDNLSSGVEDRLATDRFYIMRERRVETVLNLSWSFWDTDDSSVDAFGSSKTVDVHKTRIQGSPFDPYFSHDNLTGAQYGILGALGLSNFPPWGSLPPRP
jgi:hypothetical protein